MILDFLLVFYVVSCEFYSKMKNPPYVSDG